MFKFKGISSTDMQVVIEEEEHFIARAARRYETIEIEGRDGAIFEELGYSYVERPIYVQCLNVNKIDNILAWLDGEGEFEYKGRKTTARFYSELEPQREGYIRIIDTTFIRNPFWTKLDDEYVEVKGRKDKTTEKSSNINVKDSSDLNAKIDVFGISEQETRSGKNKANSSAYNYDTISYQDLDVNLENNEFTISTDSLRIITEYVKVPIKITENGTYTFGLELKTNTSGATAQALVYDSTNKKTIGPPLQNDTTTYAKKTTTITIDDTVDKSNINVLLYCNGTVGNAYSYSYKNIFVNPGQDAEFEQYGASPSPEYPSEIKNITGNIDITVCNKNLLDLTKCGFSNCVKNEDGSVRSNINNNYYATITTSQLNDFILQNKGKSLTFSFEGISTKTIGLYMPCKRANSDSVYFETTKTGNSITMQIPEDLESLSYIQIRWNRQSTTFTDITTVINNIQLELNDVKTDFIEHKEQLITFPLAEGQKLADGDYLASDGIHHVRDVYIFKAVTSLSIYNDNKYGTNVGAVNSINTSNILSDRIVASDSAKENTGYITGGGYTVVIYGNPTDTVESFNEKFAGTKIEYPLAKEKIEPYTEEQQEAYDQLQNVLSYKTETNVFTDKAQLVFKYIADTTEKIPNEGNVYSRPILRLEKTICNEVDIMIENVRFQYDFNDEEYVEIDCEEKEVKYEGLNRNRKIQIGYEFPKLKAGENDIKMYGGDCIVKAKRKDRWL